MVVCCCAFGCSEKMVKGGPITFHSFPKDELRRRVWHIKIRRANYTVTKNSKICSKHFTPDSFDTEKFGGTWLKKTAIPTLFDFPPHKSDPSTEKLLKELIERNAEDKHKEEIDLSLRKRKHYIGDFTDEDMDCPEEARKLLHLAKNHAEKSNKKLRRLSLKNHRLEKRVRSLQEKLEAMPMHFNCKKELCNLKSSQQQEKEEITKNTSNSGNIDMPQN